MKVSRNREGVIVGDFRGLDGAYLQTMVKRFIHNYSSELRAEILMNDPDTNETVIMALEKWGYLVIENSLSGGSYRIRVRK